MKSHSTPLARLLSIAIFGLLYMALRYHFNFSAMMGWIVFGSLMACALLVAKGITKI